MTPIELTYGLDGSLQLELPDDVRVVRCDVPRGPVVDDLPVAVAAALGQPLNYPPLVQATIPGDRMVLALSDGVPRAGEIVAAVLDTLVQGGADPASVTLLASQPREREGKLGAIEHIVHDPAVRKRLAFLGRTDDQMPILLNRELVDAGVVVSIGCLRAEDALGYHGPSGGLCPTFADEETRQRFRSLHATAAPRQHADRAKAKADEVAWLLGARLTVQVIPGPGGQVLQVLAGELDAVAQEGSKRFDAAWRCEVPELADLVIATIEGGPEQQTWDNVAAAMASAAEVAKPGAALAICCELRTPPGAALQQLAGAESLSEAMREIRKHSQPDALAAVQLARLLEEFNVYLFSPLDRDTVEDLGVVPVSDGEELARLARGRETCLVLRGAQFVRAGLAVASQCGSVTP